MSYNIPKRMVRLRENYEFVWKVVIVGDAWTGKTTYLNCMMDDKFTSETKLTIGSDFYTQYLNITLESGKNPQSMDAVCVVWDFAGERRFRTVLDSYLKGASGLMIFYDVTALGTLENITEWYQWAMTHSNANDFKDSIVVVGNKIDLGIEPEVKAKLSEFVDSIPGATHFYISCKTREKLFDPFESLIVKLLEKNKTDIESNTGIRLKKGKIIIKRAERT